MLPPLPNGPGLLLVISGPAGTGKTTLCDELLAAAPRTRRLVTCTSRDPRPGETDGVDYHFLAPAVFESALAAGQFFEHARVHGRLYGSRKADVQALLDRNHDLLFNIDVQGAATIRATCAADPALASRLITLFLYPPPLAELRQRLLDRKSDDPAEIERRLQNAAAEMARWSEFDYVLPSSTRAFDLQRLLAIYTAERLRLREGLCPDTYPVQPSA
jgi:guanylate kinase